MDDRDCITMESGLRVIQDVEKVISGLEWQVSNSTIPLPGEDTGLFANIRTRIIYNQAVSTLTIKEGGGSQDVDSDDSAGSANTSRAVVNRAKRTL